MTTGLLDFEGRNYDDDKIMLGEPLGIYDTVNRKDERYYQLHQRGIAQFWTEDEFNFSPCKKEFEKGGVEADMMIETISYQWEADSAAAGAILTVFAPFISRNDVFQLFAFNTYMETCHSALYSNVVRDSFENPNEVMDSILANQGALERVSITNKVMGKVYEISLLYAQEKISKEEAFPHVYKGMVGLLLLERLQFIASFAVTFCLGEMGIFQPIAMAVRKICSDEYNIHCETDLMVLADLRKMEYWDKTNTPEFQAQIKAMVDDTVQAELEWTEYLFRDDRKLVGMTKKQLQDWVHFNASFIYKQLGITPPVTVKENPLPWMDNWMSTANLQAAPQEQEIANYLVGQLADDTDDMEFEV